MADLMAASHQWATRPADERFETLDALYKHCADAYAAAQTANVVVKETTAEVEGNDIVLATTAGKMRFNNWSFNQMSTRLGAPGSYLSTLPAELAVQNLNYNITQSDGVISQLYFDSKTLTARAFTSPTYARVPNYEVVKRIQELPGNWVVPPARPAMEGQPGTRIATEEDCKCSTLIKPGDTIAPAGLYGSDRDMFVFMVDPGNRIDDGTEEGLSRGFFIRNSEVGDRSLSIVKFRYRYTCGNHIVWGAEQVEKVKHKHYGNINDRYFASMALLKAYAEESAEKDIAMIKSAKAKELGASRDEVVDFVFGKKWLGRKMAESAFTAAEEHSDVDGSPRSLWGFSQGITRISQKSPYANERAELDAASGKVLALAV